MAFSGSSCEEMRRVLDGSASTLALTTVVAADVVEEGKFDMGRIGDGISFASLIGFCVGGNFTGDDAGDDIGEQVHVLACLSACNQETEIITPFKVAAVMCKNGKRKGAKKQNGNMEGEKNPVPGGGDVSLNGAVMDQNGDNLEKDKIDPAKDVSASESFLRMEDHRRQTETHLKRFKNSHFFVRIAESGEPLWSKKGASGGTSESSEMDTQQSIANETKNTAENISTQSAVIDRGNFNASVSGGVARDAISCCSLSNGDLVVWEQKRNCIC
ncbi:hypothetical protein V6N13_055632 [Hibiscus sabdariffa]